MEIDWDDIQKVAPLAEAFVKASESLIADYREVTGNNLLAEDMHTFAYAVLDAVALYDLIKSVTPPGYALTWFETDYLMKGLP